MIKSFRLRLTAWYLAFFSLLFVLFGAFLYGTLASALEKRLDQSLVSLAGTAAVLFEEEIEEMHGDVEKAAAEAVSEMQMGGGTVAIYAGHTMLAASGPVAGGEQGAVVAQVLAGAASNLVVGMPRSGANGARAAARRLAKAGTTYVVLTVEPLDSIAASLQVVRRALLFGMPLLLVLAGVGGYWLSTRSLAPLGWMAEQSRRISGRNLHTRLEIGDAAGELTMLAGSFN
jgi:hypothetical protein